MITFHGLSLQVREASVFDLMFVVLCTIVMYGLALSPYIASLCMVLCSFEKFSICLSRFE